MRAAVGTDVVDLADPRRSEHFPTREASDEDRAFVARHLTARERAAYAALAPDEGFGWFWARFAAKEAAFKAFDQAGIPTARGSAGYLSLETSADCTSVTHLSTGRGARLASLERSSQLIHAAYFLEGEEGSVFSSLALVPQGADASEFARSLLVRQAADAFEAPISRFFVTSVDGRPRLLLGGALLPHSISLAHSGRFAAASLLA